MSASVGDVQVLELTYCGVKGVIVKGAGPGSLGFRLE